MREAVTARGGQTHARVTRKVDYLVVGSMVTQSWITSTHGRKILEAVDQKKAGHRIKIVQEHVRRRVPPSRQSMRARPLLSRNASYVNAIWHEINLLTQRLGAVRISGKSRGC